MTVTDAPTALEIITEALPVDLLYEETYIGNDSEGVCLWGPPALVAGRIHAALVEAGYLAGVTRPG